MRKLAILAALVAASAFAALKPGYRYHRDVLPSDQVPADFETVMSNYLGSAGYVPSHVTNTETVVYSVTNNFTEVHSVTNNFYDEKWVTNNVVLTTNILTHETREITNNVTRNFYQEFWYTNNLYEVRELTNVVHEVNEITNNIYQIFSNEYRNVIYETTNRTEYVTNNVTDEIWHTVVYSNVYENVISNRWIYDHREIWSTNNLVTWATNNIHTIETNFHYDVVWTTNNLVTWATNNLVTVETNYQYDVLWVTNNLVTWATNNLVTAETNYIYTVETQETYHTDYRTVETTNLVRYTEFTNIYWSTTREYFHTNNIITWATNVLTQITTNREDHYVFTTKEITNEVTTVEITTNVDVKVTNFTTNMFANWYTDRISFTNGLERHEIDALNKRYVAYRRIVERYNGPYWTADKLAHVFGTNMVPIYTYGDTVDWAVFNTLSDGAEEGAALDSLDVASSGIHLVGSAVPILDFLDAEDYSEMQGYDCCPILLGFRVDGGYFGVSGTTTNYVTATTIPGIGDYLIAGYTIYGANYRYTEDPVTSFTAPDYALFHYCLRVADGDLYWIPGAQPDGLSMTLRSGKTGSVIPSSMYTFTTYTRNEGGYDVWTTNWTHYVSELADFNDLRNYGAFYTAEDVVSNEFFRTAMSDAMQPYTAAAQGYANDAQVRANEAKAAYDNTTNAVKNLDAALNAAVDRAAMRAEGAASSAWGGATSANNAAGSASSSASAAREARAAINVMLEDMRGFTNWFEHAKGSVVSNVNVSMTVTQTVTADPIADLENETTGTIRFCSGGQLRIPRHLTETWNETSYGNHTFTLDKVITVYSQYSGNTGYQILYKNDGYPTSAEGTDNRVHLYKYGITFVQMAKDPSTGEPSQWRLCRNYSWSGTSSFSWYFDDFLYTIDLMSPINLTLHSKSASYVGSDIVYARDGELIPWRSVDFATQAELNSAILAEQTARGDADTAIQNTVAQVALDLTNLVARVEAIEERTEPRVYVSPGGTTYSYITYYPIATENGKVQVSRQSTSTSASTQYRFYPNFGGKISTLYWTFSPGSTKTGANGLELHYAPDAPIGIPETTTSTGTALTGNTLMPGDLFWNNGTLYLDVTAVNSSGAVVGQIRMKYAQSAYPGSISGGSSDTTSGNYVSMTYYSRTGTIMGTGIGTTVLGHLKTANGKTATVVWIPE